MCIRDRFSTAFSAFIVTVMVNQFSEDDVLANTAANCITICIALPSAVYGYFLTWKGSEYVSLDRLDLFQGLAREGFWVTAILSIFVGSFYTFYKSTCVNNITNSLDKAGVESSLDNFHAAVIVCAVFKSMQLLFQNVLIACSHFKQNAIAIVVVQVCMGLTLGGIGLGADSMPFTYVGSTTMPAVVLGLGFIFYTVRWLKPAQDRYLESIGRPMPPLLCCTACASCEQRCCPACFRSAPSKEEQSAIEFTEHKNKIGSEESSVEGPTSKTDEAEKLPSMGGNNIATI
eukprot:TRINITY_DN9842_c0_g1_i1.p1 TRINITY_DN9842_c0_g1~~TRINITY_DN9842_c0_g1_i1.p1  ORF type:complete len:288 (+),score=56.97 TRINITY_DN9842_c0_g1_i1:125-988(+)